MGDILALSAQIAYVTGMADEFTKWDDDGMGTYTSWDDVPGGPGETLWDRLPAIIGRTIRVVWEPIARSVDWQSIARKVTWR